MLFTEVANGMYKKPIEVLAREIHYDALPDDVRMVIAAWTLGVVARAAVEQIIPEALLPSELTG